MCFDMARPTLNINITNSYISCEVIVSKICTSASYTVCVCVCVCVCVLQDEKYFQPFWIITKKVVIYLLSFIFKGSSCI